jgi:hypothetical protein
MRLMSEVIERVRARIGRDFVLGVRFDAEECIKGGYTVLESRQMALRMARLSVDYISLSAGGKFEDAIQKPGAPLYPYTGYSGDRCMPSASYPDGTNVAMAEGIKRHLVAHGFHTPVVTTGKIATPALAEEILEQERADLIGMARALLADPDWPKKVREGREQELIRCVYGNVCKNLDENSTRWCASSGPSTRSRRRRARIASRHAGRAAATCARRSSPASCISRGRRARTTKGSTVTTSSAARTADPSSASPRPRSRACSIRPPPRT